ncbi:MAG: SMP-30/gluconolactonase/LRE family protein [Planctomycetota bacterium]
MDIRRFFVVALAGACLVVGAGCSDSVKTDRDAVRYAFTHPIPDHADLRLIQSGYEFTEGPAWDGIDSLFFNDLPSNRTLRYNVDSQTMTTYISETGRANGMMFSPEGELLVCRVNARKLARLEDGHYVTLAEAYKGVPLNSPNDLVIDDAGGVYFTDPRYHDRHTMNMKVEGVYYLSASGELTRVIGDLVRPNGIMLSPNGRTLYVADHGDQKVIAYDIYTPGELRNKRVFCSTPKSGVDGMTVDVAGNLYVTTTDVDIYDRRGAFVATIPMPEKPGNCTFGGHDRKTLFITASTGFYSIRMNVPGAR